MPLHDYRCLICGAVTGDRAEPPTVCFWCKANKFKKLPAAPAIRFKGAGWTKPTAKKEE